MKVKKIKILLKSDTNDRYSHERLCKFVIISSFFLEWEIFQTEVLGKMKAHILCSINFIQKLSFMRLCVGGQATDHHIIRHMKGGIGVPDNCCKNTHTQNM
jgi:hypothetical protein